ncbi:hypothetical protein Tco_0367821 [Tanacetum coccineum]
MNHLKIDNLTQEHLVGLAFKLLKGTCKSRVELEYNIKEYYKVVTDRLDWNNPEGKEYPFNLSKPLLLIMERGRQVVPVNYFLNNDLDYPRERSSSKKYTTSTTKTKVAKYGIPRIEDMVPSRIVILKRVKNLQLGVESYQKKLNITKPKTFRALTSIRTVLHDITSNLRMDYLPKRRWSNLDRQRSRIMIKAIDKLLLEIRLMGSLEKFIGGRDYGEDLRLLERTIWLCHILSYSISDVLTVIENKTNVYNSRNKSIVSQVKSSDVNSSSSSDIAKLTHAVNQQTSAVTTAMTAILKQFQATPPPASVKDVEEICVTCGGAHPYYQCLAADGNTFLEFQDNIQGYVSAVAVNYNQGNFGYRPPGVANQTRPSGFAQQNVQNNQNRFSQPQGYNRGNNFNQNANYQAPIQQNQSVPLSELENFKKINDVNIKSMQTQINNVKNKLRNGLLKSPLHFQFTFRVCNGVETVLDGPFVPMPPSFINPEEDERVEETLTDPEHGEFTIKVPPPLVQKAKPPSQRNYVVHQRDPRHPHIPYPSRMNQEKLKEKDEV